MACQRPRWSVRGTCSGTAADAVPCPPLSASDWQIWQIWALETQAVLRQQTDLTRQLVDFVAKKR